MQYSSLVARKGQLLFTLIFLLFALPGVAAMREGPLVLPDNAYANGQSFGKGWDCEFGYRETRTACIETVVPANGHLSSRGDDWQCDRGFREESEQCVRIRVPENAYLTDSSSKPGWVCERGHRSDRSSCPPIQLPENAYLTNSPLGKGWECERGYKLSGKACVAVQVPVNAYLVDRNYGPGWQCERGYASNGSKTCNKLNVPANAHLTRNGDEWKCNAPYSKRGQLCKR